MKRNTFEKEKKLENKINIQYSIRYVECSNKTEKLKRCKYTYYSPIQSISLFIPLEMCLYYFQFRRLRRSQGVRLVLWWII